MGKSQPKAPDPTQTANAQAAANAQAVRESAKVAADPSRRDEIIQKMQAAGFSTEGL